MTQGDLLWDFPVLRWQAAPPEGDVRSRSDVELLDAANEVVAMDLIVLTQACDLEQRKVSEVVLSPCVSLTEFRPNWEVVQKSRGQGTTDKAWKSYCENMTKGYLWDQSIIDAHEGDPEELRTDERVVLFSEVLTCPRWFIEDIIRRKAVPRLRLLPPYREHVSQAFARFFMRVGLPSPVTKSWTRPK